MKIQIKNLTNNEKTINLHTGQEISIPGQISVKVDIGSDKRIPNYYAALITQDFDIIPIQTANTTMNEFNNLMDAINNAKETKAKFEYNKQFASKQIYAQQQVYVNETPIMKTQEAKYSTEPEMINFRPQQINQPELEDITKTPENLKAKDISNHPMATEEKNEYDSRLATIQAEKEAYAEKIRQAADEEMKKQAITQQAAQQAAFEQTYVNENITQNQVEVIIDPTEEKIPIGRNEIPNIETEKTMATSVSDIPIDIPASDLTLKQMNSVLMNEFNVENVREMKKIDKISLIDQLANESGISIKSLADKYKV